MESGAVEVPPTLTAQNDLIWTLLILIGILPVSTQIGGYRSPGGRQCELHPVTGGRWCLAPRREHRRPVPGKTMTG